MNLAEELKARGVGRESSAPLEKILETKRGIYLGMDPTADSLHVGHLVPLMLMKRLADAGHRAVFLVGGGTGMIGDPRDSGERSLLDKRTLEHNKRALRAQLQKILGRKIEMVDNASWLGKLGLLEFLRDTGKHFSVNDLVKRDLIKRRLETPDESISFTEFSYALLQGFDFLTLYKKKGVSVQVGASDQWTNMLSGVDLIRRKQAEEAFCFTCPLVTDANGKKFGKSEGNAVWLDGKKTSPFKFYQFWIGLPDEGLETYLKLYTFLPVSEIDALMEKHRGAPQDREAQETLARLVTEIVHGPAATAQAAAASDALFGGRPLSQLSREERAVLMGEAVTVTVSKADASKSYPIADALVAGNLASSKSEARRLIEGKGVSINGKPVDSVDPTIRTADFDGGLAILRKGKRDMVVLVLK
ncbi:MAG TPA: tyrosine--tRNA ligase [Candidatus Paceibacterota bacterium]|nr:tyrosine--tRNA ligase [Candidatus Paceibacterota bacterium]